VKYLRNRKYLDALCVYFWATTPVIIAILTFATYVLLENELDAKKRNDIYKKLPFLKKR